MDHGKCCNCFVCKLGKAFGFIEECECKPKKVVKKKTAVKSKKVAKKKKVVKKK